MHHREAGPTGRCPVQPNTPLGPDQVNALLWLLLLSYRALGDGSGYVGTDLNLRKGYEWEDFRLFTNSEWLDSKWVATMGGEPWKDAARKPFPDQKIFVSELTDPMQLSRKEELERRQRDAWHCYITTKNPSLFGKWSV
jgi:hypothetical protein